MVTQTLQRCCTGSDTLDDSHPESRHRPVQLGKFPAAGRRRVQSLPVHAPGQDGQIKRTLFPARDCSWVRLLPTKCCCGLSFLLEAEAQATQTPVNLKAPSHTSSLDSFVHPATAVRIFLRQIEAELGKKKHTHTQKLAFDFSPRTKSCASKFAACQAWELQNPAVLVGEGAA